MIYGTRDYWQKCVKDRKPALGSEIPIVQDFPAKSAITEFLLLSVTTPINRSVYGNQSDAHDAGMKHVKMWMK